MKYAAVRLMNYNIFEGGVTLGNRLDVILEVVKRSDPDVLALDECNGFTDDGMRTRYRLEQELGMRSALLQTRTGFHIALFVKNFQIDAVHTMVDWFHHGAIRVALRQGGQKLTVIATHLCPFSGESRVREAQYLSSYIRDERVVVMGDMNAISPHDVAQLDLTDMLPHRRSRHFVPSSDVVDTRAMDVFASAGLVDLWHRARAGEPGRTLPTPLVDGSEDPVLRVDYILATPVLADSVTHCHVIVDETTRRASDHYPIVADIEL